MVSLSQIKTSNASLTGANLPQTIVMTGATGGIGAATLTLLAHKSAEANSPMRIYLLGRNGDRHAAFLDSLRNLSPSTLELVWIECQVSLLADIKRAALEITRKESHIDVLFVSAGVLPWSLNETDEGLDLSLALAYYSRMALVSHLLPLLKASTCANGPRVVDVLDTGNETANLPLNDIGLKKPGNRGPVYFVPVGATYTTVALDRLARRAGGEVVMIHNHPGIVHTNILAKGWGNGVVGKVGKAFMQYVLVPFTRVVGFSAEESGERCLFLMTSAVYGGRGVPVARGVQEGVNAKGSKGTDIVWTVDQKFKTGQMAKVLKEVEDKGIDDKIWGHTMEVLNPYM